jgi:hypothetical protein
MLSVRGGGRERERKREKKKVKEKNIMLQTYMKNNLKLLTIAIPL